MCSHLNLTRDDRKFLKWADIKSWSVCGFCEKPEPKARPTKQTRLRTEESVNRESEDDGS